MRAFIAIKVKPGEKIKSLISNLSKFKELKTVNLDNFHITVKFLGEITESQAERVSKALEETRGFGKIRIIMKSVGCFPDKQNIRVIWIGAESDKLISLKELIENKLEKEGFFRDNGKFVPHATVARAKEKPSKEVEKLLGNTPFFEFDADELHLMKSRLSAKGTEHSSVKKVKL